MIKYNEKDNYIIFEVRVVPRASKTEIVGELGGELKVKIASAPIAGAANAELIKLLAKKFGVAKSSVEIVNGETSKIKKIKIYNLKNKKMSHLFRELNFFAK